MPSEFRPQAAKNPRSSGASPMSGPLSGVNDSGTAEEGLDPRRVQRGEPVHRVGQVPAHPLPVRRQHRESQVLRDLVERPRRALGLEQADQDAARFLPVVAVAIRVLHDGKVRMRPCHRFGDQVVVLGCLERQGDAGKLAELATPHPGRVHDRVALDGAVVGIHPRHAAVRLEDAGDGDALDDPRASHPRALGVGLGDVGGVRTTLVGDPGRGEDVVHLRLGPQALHLRGVDHLDRDPVALREQRLAGDGLQPLGRAGQMQVADRAEPGVLAGLLRELGKEVGGVARHPLERLVRHPRGRDEPGGVPRRPGGELLALQQDHVGHADLREVVGDAAADHAAADDDDLCASGYRAVIGHGGSDLLWSRRSAG